MLDRIDHLVFAAADLDEGIAVVEALTGVRAQKGGPHPGVGSHNALMALGPLVYLEIMAPDPGQERPRPLSTIGLGETRRSRMVGWALAEADLAGVVARAGAKGVPMVGPRPGSRQVPGGGMLEWRTAALTDQGFGEGAPPFFIDWGATAHPATTSPDGGRLVGWRVQHPSPALVQPIFEALGIPLTIEAAPEVTFIATLDTPRGRVELR